VGDYHVTVIAPELYTCFTPLLPCEFLGRVNRCWLILFVAAAVGTVHVRSLMESLRKIIARVRGHFIAGRAVDVVMGERLLEVESEMDGSVSRFYIPCVSRRVFGTFLIQDRYDKLIIACGSTAATHGVSGLENCFQLKNVGDALAIRKRLLGSVPIAAFLRAEQV
jgi:NADH dehydrogenase FAD-containing subunit